MTAAERFMREIKNAITFYQYGNSRAIQPLVRSQFTDRVQQKYVAAFWAAGVPDAVIFGNDQDGAPRQAYQFLLISSGANLPLAKFTMPIDAPRDRLNEAWVDLATQAIQLNGLGDSAVAVVTVHENGRTSTVFRSDKDRARPLFI